MVGLGFLGSLLLDPQEEVAPGIFCVPHTPSRGLFQGRAQLSPRLPPLSSAPHSTAPLFFSACPHPPFSEQTTKSDSLLFCFILWGGKRGKVWGKGLLPVAREQWSGGNTQLLGIVHWGSRASPVSLGAPSPCHGPPGPCAVSAERGWRRVGQRRHQCPVESW